MRIARQRRGEGAPDPSHRASRGQGSDTVVREAAEPLVCTMNKMPTGSPAFPRWDAKGVLEAESAQDGACL